jgi:hypothetical protein
VLAGGAAAHVTRSVGGVTVSYGWGVEPPVAGAVNFVELELENVRGRPIRDSGSLVVQVVYGDERTTLAFDPDESPGAFAAPIVPTQPGVYTFHLTGTVAGAAIDLRTTCSEHTFDCVVSPDALAFPGAVPSGSALAQRIARVDARADDAATTRRIAYVALAVAAIALAVAVAMAMGRRRT